MKKKLEVEKKEKKSKTVKKESTIVTKESICATCALFFFLGFLILCTRTLIFGDLGGSIHAMLTGVFGYMAYPLFLGAMYLCVMGWWEKAWVKIKKRAGFSVSLLSV